MVTYAAQVLVAVRTSYFDRIARRPAIGANVKAQPYIGANMRSQRAYLWACEEFLNEASFEVGRTPGEELSARIGPYRGR